MSNIIMYTNSEVVAATVAKEKEMKIKEAQSNTASTTAETTVTETAPEAATENIAAEATTEGATTEVIGEATDATTADAAVSDVAVDAAATDSGMAIEGEVAIEKPMPADTGMGGDIGFDEGMYTDPTMQTGMATVKDPLLSSWPFVIGISAAVLFVSVAFGVLLARRKIKKGIELYED